MNFNDLLRVQGIDPKKVLIMRHRPKEVQLQRILPLLAAEHHELYNAYQQTQGAREEKMLQRAVYLGSFIGHESGKALFVGLYRRGQTTPMTLDEYSRPWADHDRRLESDCPAVSRGRMSRTIGPKAANTSTKRSTSDPTYTNTLP